MKLSIHPSQDSGPQAGVSAVTLVSLRAASRAWWAIASVMAAVVLQLVSSSFTDPR